MNNKKVIEEYLEEKNKNGSAGLASGFGSQITQCPEQLQEI